MASSKDLIKWKVFLSRVIYLSIILFVIPSIGEYLDGFAVEFDISLPLASWALTLMAGLSLLVGPIIQIVYRYFSYRHVSVAAGLVFGLLFIAIGAIARSTIHIYLCAILSGVTLGAVDLASYLELGEHFKSNFGMANTATNFISGLLTIGGPLLIEHFKEEYGLRKTLILTGAVTWHLVLSGVCLTTKKLTTPFGDKSQNEVETDRTKSFLKSHPYLLSHYIFLTFAFIRALGIPIFLYPFAISKELSHAQAAILTSMFNFGSMVGRLIALGTFFWKLMTLPLVETNVITVTPVLVSMMAQLLSLFVTNELVLSLMAITAGISTGFEISWGMSSAMDLSCKEHFKTTGSWVLFFCGLGATFGGLIVGSTHDIRGSYDDVMTLIIILSGLQVIFIVITLTWKRLVKECSLQDNNALRKLDCNVRTCK